MNIWNTLKNGIRINISKANYGVEIDLHTLSPPGRGFSTAGPCEFYKIFDTVHNGKTKEQSAEFSNNFYRMKKYKRSAVHITTGKYSKVVFKDISSKSSFS